MTRIRRWCLVVVCVAAQTATLAAWPCAFVPDKAVFESSRHPDFPLKNYAQGSLGILLPTFARSYLVIAYRHLSGLETSEDEQRQTIELWHDRIHRSVFGKHTVCDLLQWRDRWIAARNTLHVPAAVTSPAFDVFRRDLKNGEYIRYVHYTQDAFRAAVQTLQNMEDTYGIGSAEVLEWARGQDSSSRTPTRRTRTFPTRST